MIKIFSLNNEGAAEYKQDPAYEHVTYSGALSEVIELLDTADDTDIIGLFFGNRFLVRNSLPLSSDHIESVFKRYDMILPFEGNVEGCVKDRCGKGAGTDMILQKIDLLYGFLSKYYDKVINSRRIFDGGAVISGCKLLKEFYQMALDILGDEADLMDMACLLKSWIMSRSLKVRSEMLSRENPEVWNNGYERIRVVQKCMDSLLGEYINLRKQTGFKDSFAGENPYQKGFGDKIPVWLCWWQGLDQAPEMVKVCVDSLQKNLPDYAQVILITMDNWSEYVTFTDSVIDKFNREIITYTHLSDILRAELLYRYGGMWIDATYYVSHPIPDDILKSTLYSIAFRPPLWQMDLQRGRWTLSLLVSKKGNPAMQFLMESLWVYWEQADELIDYFVVDYCMDAGYRHFEDIRDQIDAISASPPAVYDLQLTVNQAASLADVEALAKDSLFYKLNRRNEYVKKTSYGELTIYGYMTGSGIPVEEKNYIRIKGTEGNETISICDRTDIAVHSEKELISVIRESNPYRIMDESDYFGRNNWICGGILDDIIKHGYTIEIPK